MSDYAANKLTNAIYALSLSLAISLSAVVIAILSLKP